jgi:hypothetical protein
MVRGAFDQRPNLFKPSVKLAAELPLEHEWISAPRDRDSMGRG